MNLRTSLRGTAAAALLVSAVAIMVAVVRPDPVLSATVFATPPPGGITQGIAGTDDPVELAAAQSFDVQAVWFMEGGLWRVYVPGAPRGSGVLSADAVVTIRRSGTLVPGHRELSQPDTNVIPSGDAIALPVPPPGGLALGLAGTNDPARLVAQQSFEVASIFVLDVPTQRWLVYVPGAPAMVSSLRVGLLREDSIVTVRRAMGPVVSSPAPIPAAVTADEATMVDLVNQARVANGLSALIIDPEMVAVARAHSADMSERDFFAHTNPDGADPFDRMGAAGITYRRAGE
ncbi:MAG: CAP domain-containing protein, partial [Dehalococcoidia bacterium]